MPTPGHSRHAWNGNTIDLLTDYGLLASPGIPTSVAVNKILYYNFLISSLAEFNACQVSVNSN